jgi:hypothetical protein
MPDETKLRSVARGLNSDASGANASPTLPSIRRKDRQISCERRDADDERKGAICSDSLQCKNPFEKDCLRQHAPRVCLRRDTWHLETHVRCWPANSQAENDATRRCRCTRCPYVPPERKVAVHSPPRRRPSGGCAKLRNSMSVALFHQLFEESITICSMASSRACHIPTLQTKHPQKAVQLGSVIRGAGDV